MTRWTHSPHMSAASEFFGSAGFARALATCAVGTTFLSHALRSVLGWPGLVAIVAALVVLASASIVARRKSLEWRGLLTISLLAFVGWCAVSVFWSDYQWASLAGVLYQSSVALLGVYIALLRDPIQIVRTFGDVLRAVLGASLVLEVLAGLLIDSPIRFLGITGGLDSGGPIQGLFGSRNQLGLVALIALVTFVVEALTRSVRRGVWVGSVAGATIIILLTRSPVAFGALAVTAAAALVLFALRRMSPERRRVGQFALSAAIVVTLAVAWLARSRIIETLNAGSEFEYRYSVWQRILNVVSLSPIEGFGWLGLWRIELPPYVALDAHNNAEPSAFNAFLDALLQVGVVGLVLLVVLVALALTRSWFLAANKKSVVYVWAALVLVVLVVTSAAESAILVEFGWLVLVICAVRASEGLSWRLGLRDTESTGGSVG